MAQEVKSTLAILPEGWSLMPSTTQKLVAVSNSTQVM